MSDASDPTTRNARSCDIVSQIIEGELSGEDRWTSTERLVLIYFAWVAERNGCTGPWDPVPFDHRAICDALCLGPHELDETVAALQREGVLFASGDQFIVPGIS